MMPNMPMMILQGKLPQETLHTFDTLTQTFQDLSLSAHVRQHFLASSRLQSQIAVHPFKGDLDTLDALARESFALKSLEMEPLVESTLDFFGTFTRLSLMSLMHLQRSPDALLAILQGSN